MKPGNLRLQGAKSGGGNRKMRECLNFKRLVCDGALFDVIPFERNCDKYGSA